MAIEYFYSGDSVPSKSKGQYAEIEKLQTTAANKLFKFDPNFINDMQKIKPIELGQAVPYISLSIMKHTGEELENFNVLFFHAPLELGKLNQKTMFPERPNVSLMEVIVKTEQSSGGYMFFTHVTITLKVHRPDAVTNSMLLAMLFPGMPFRLKYGWNTGEHTKNDFLKHKEILLFSLRTYEISYSEDGQADLVIEGTAFNEKFDSIYIGDDGTKEEGQKYKGGIAENIAILEKRISWMESQLKRKDTDNSSRNYEIIQQQLQSYQVRLKTSKGAVHKNFKRQLDLLTKSPVKQPSSHFKTLFGEKVNVKKFRNDFMSFHDVVSILCTSTFNAMDGKIFPSGNNIKFRLIYGQIDKKSGAPGSKIAGKSIADFPIDYKMFIEAVGDYVDSGQDVLTISGLFNILARGFLDNNEYWAKLEGTKDIVRLPYPVVHFTNHEIDGTQYVDIHVLDINNDIPTTTAVIKEIAESKKTATQDEFEKRVLGDPPSLPIIRIGHANSFIKKLKMSNITDEYVKAVFISRMAENSAIDVSEFVPPEIASENLTDVDTPLQMPLQGDMEVLGHPSWKPNKAFYLSTGLGGVVDGVYKILSVTHKIGRDGFSTNIEFLYN